MFMPRYSLCEQQDAISFSKTVYVHMHIFFVEA